MISLIATPLTLSAAEQVAPAPPVDAQSEVSNALRASEMPKYRLSIDLHPHKRRVIVHQQVTWTNPGTAATDELVFQVVPNHRLSQKMISLGERTAESLRLNPRYSIDKRGRRFHMTEATVDGKSVTCSFSRQHDTHLHFPLSRNVEPGETVTVSLRYWLDIPDIMGRFGHHKDVTNLLNWYPVLAVYQGSQWKPVPYIPWHQPWFNEAGIYDVKLRLPGNQKVVTGGHVRSRKMLPNGYRELAIHGEGLRDFTIVASHRFHELRDTAGSIPVRVQYLPGHREHAEVALRTAVDCLQTYSRWFGKYPYREFELTESFFGWNGNESSGVVMVDSRIFDLPKFADRYTEHLVSHEICHQWWYSAVGTNGYREPFMDEGLVTWLTRVKMEDKYGKETPLLDLPGLGPVQFPNVQYQALVHNGYQAYTGRGGDGISAGSLDEIGHLHNLFALVYDRGARVTGLIQKQLGREQFFNFLRQVYRRYEFRILTIDGYQRELEAFTGKSWEPFFQQWLYESQDADWELAEVTVDETQSGYRTEARIHSSGAPADNVDVQVSFDNEQRPFRLATLSQLQHSGNSGVQVKRLAPNDWLVTVVSDEKPTQVAVDPDGYVIESDPFNNTWKADCDVRVSPLYTPVDEASLMQPWQRHSCVAGFGLDSDGRIGFRGALTSSNRYRLSPFLAYTAATASRNDDHISAGIDFQVFNFPSANWQFLARYEHALLSTLANDPGHQARIALRRVLNYTTSLIYPNLSYIDFYTRFGDNFFPDEDNTVNPDPSILQYDNVRAFGIDYHVDSQLPYWNPDRGFRFDGNYEHGFRAFGDGENYDRLSGQLGVVQRLSIVDGWLGETKIAGRLAGGYGNDNFGEHFRLGGPGRFRGRNATDTEGNAFWLTSLEWRFPIAGDVNYRVLDNVAALKALDGAVFWDVGQSYLRDEAQGKPDHAIGLGLYWNIPLLSFVEHLTIRTEYGYSMTNSTGASGSACIARSKKGAGTRSLSVPSSSTVTGC